MPYKIAVASSDGKVINQHFGRSKQFLIFDVSDTGEYKFSELRQSTPPCGLGEHHENEMQKVVNLLSDCRFVLVSQIGSGAEQALRVKGLQSFAIGDFIENAISKIISFGEKKFLKREISN